MLQTAYRGVVEQLFDFVGNIISINLNAIEYIKR